MSGSKKLIGQITTRYLEQYTDIKSRTLARKMYDENPTIFSCTEHARGVIRYYRAKKGAYNRGSVQDHRFVNTGTGTNPIKPPDLRGTAKVLLLDIETTPIWSYTWDVWKQNVNPCQIIRPWNILSWAAKWLFDPEMHSDVLTPSEAKAGDDKRISATLWEYIDAADVIVAHNGIKFDLPKINTRFLLHGLKPPAPYQTIDTCLVARKKFGFEHNKLDYLAERLGLPRKIDTEFQLWIDCMMGHSEALLEMITYNKQDVLILEEVYVAMRSWIPVHPNMGLFVTAEQGQLICPVCGNVKTEYVGYYSTPVNQYKAFRCQDCGAIGRSRNTDTTVKQKRSLLYANAR
jgi:hypothetical protein